MQAERHSRRRGRTGSHRPATGAPAIAYRHLSNRIPLAEPLSGDQIEAIHAASLALLQDPGIRVLDPEGRRLYRDGGADVDEKTQVVRLGPDLVDRVLETAPEIIPLNCRNPERNQVLGGRNIAFGTVGGTPNASDLDRGRRPGDFNAFCDLLRLAQSFDVIHVIGPVTEPLDVPPHLRHLDMTAAQVTLTDKFPFIFSRGRQQVADCFDILKCGLGLDDAGFTAQPHCYTVVNVNSPMQLDSLMTRGLIDFAAAGQVVVVTPFTLAGAMAPITLAGAIAQQNAEALAGIALTQIVRPGAPVIYGGFTSNVDMKSGAPAFGTPEYVKACWATGQLARRYRLPWRSSGSCTSNIPDAQAAYETQMALWGALGGGCNYLMHGAGWLEGGLVASYEKFVIDIEMLQMMAELFRPIETDTASLGVDAVREAGFGGHFFGTTHTMERYATAFYAPILSDYRNFDSWQGAGSPDCLTRANALWKKTLAEYQAPALPEDRTAALAELLARRKEAGGAPIED